MNQQLMLSDIGSLMQVVKQNLGVHVVYVFLCGRNFCSINILLFEIRLFLLWGPVFSRCLTLQRFKCKFQTKF